MKPLNYFLRNLFLILIITSFSSNAQIGIGTTTPEGALDINGALGGLVIPRTNLGSVTDLITCANPQGGDPVKGTIIYNLGETIAEGFYYFDGAVWQNMQTTDNDDYLAINDQTLTADRDIFLANNDLNIDVSSSGSNGLTIDTDYLAFSRDAGNSADGLISSRGGMAFNLDSDNGNSNDSEYFSWGQDGNPGEATGDSSYDELMRLDDTGLGIGTNNPETKIHVVETTSNINVAKFQSPEFPMFAGFIIEDTGGNNTF